MRKIILLLFLAVITGCSDTPAQLKKLQEKVDELEKKLNDTYKPGFGEFMSIIQVHHAKLWFAGINGNWKLADFEIGEIKEAMENLKKYQADRAEIKTLPMVFPALDGVTAAVSARDVHDFKTKFENLTNTCNACHQAVGYGFNDVKIPASPPFSNQIFKNK